MKDSNVERKFKNAISNCVPDVLEDLIKECEETKEGFNMNNEKKFNEGISNDFIGKKDIDKNVDNNKVINNKDLDNKNIVDKEKNNRENNTNKYKMSKFALPLVAVLALVIGISIGGMGGFNKGNTSSGNDGNNDKGIDKVVDSVIEFDINPSIEVKINKAKRVVEAEALNQDGEKVLQNMDLENTDLDVAINAIVGSMLKNGYITEVANSILVSVKNEDINKGNELQEEISKEIEELLKASHISAAVLSQMYEDDEVNKKLAVENNMSEGKARLVSKILDLNVKDAKGKALTVTDLSNMSINELNLLIDSKNMNIKDVSTKGKASSKSYIGEEKAKSIAYIDAKVSSSNVSKVKVELDYDDGQMVYDVEFQVGNTEYDYEINAKDGRIIEKEVENEDNDDDNVENDYNDEENDDDDVNEKNAVNNKSTTKNTSSNNKSETSKSNKTVVATPSTTSYIGKEKAKNIAYSNAGVSSSNAKNTKVELDADDGRKIYEIEFEVDKTEYEYEIDAISGSILSKDVDRDDD